ncbi:MAG: helix-turn-helix transcriptional regulator [Candidatus Hadarchaeales archaeon]
MSKKEATLVAREMIASRTKKSISDIVSATGLPKWKVARILKRFEKLNLVSVSDEVTFSVGRPRKLYSITDNGMKFFGEIGVEIFEILKTAKHERADRR